MLQNWGHDTTFHILNQKQMKNSFVCKGSGVKCDVEAKVDQETGFTSLLEVFMRTKSAILKDYLSCMFCTTSVSVLSSHPKAGLFSCQPRR